MDLDELKTIWKKQKINRDIDHTPSEMAMLINNRMISFEKEIRWRDRFELIACAVVILAFGFWFFTTSSVWTQIGCAIIVFSSLFIAYKLKSAQPGKIKSDSYYDHSIIEHLEEEMEKVEEQRNLIQSVLWWYILPLYTGLVFVTIGFQLPIIYKWIYLAIITTLAGGIWYMNQKAARENLEPLIQDIRESIRFLETN